LSRHFRNGPDHTYSPPLRRPVERWALGGIIPIARRGGWEIDGVAACLRARPFRARLLFADLFEALLQVFVVLFPQGRIAWAAVDFARFVFPFVELLAGPLVMDVSRVGRIDDPLRQLRRDEGHAFLIADNEIARKNRDTADANRNVDA